MGMGWGWGWDGDGVAGDGDGSGDGDGNGDGAGLVSGSFPPRELSAPPLWLRTDVTLNAKAGAVGTEFFHPYSQLSGGD